MHHLWVPEDWLGNHCSKESDYMQALSHRWVHIHCPAVQDAGLLVNVAADAGNAGILHHPFQLHVDLQRLTVIHPCGKWRVGVKPRPEGRQPRQNPPIANWGY